MTLILAPAGTTQSIQTIPQAGDRFYIVDCDTDTAVGIKTHKTQQELFTVGTGKQFTPDQAFQTLEIENFSADIVTLVMFSGYGDYIDKRTTIVGNRLSSVLPTIEPKTLPVAGATASIASGGNINLAPSITGTRLRRKAITVSNLDPNANLQIRDVGNVNVLLTIFPQTSIILPLSEACFIFNASAGAIALSYGEIYWLKPTA